MTPEQWWDLYGSTIGAEDEWSSGVLAVIDQTWSTELAELVSPYTNLVGGGWDVGAAAVMDLLTVDWSETSAVGTMVTNIIGQIVGEAMTSIAGSVPIVGVVVGLLETIMNADSEEYEAQKARARAEAQREQQDCLTQVQSYAVNGTGPANAVLPADWFVQAEFGSDMRPHPTGKEPSFGQMWDAMLQSWSCWQVHRVLIREWDMSSFRWPGGSFATENDWLLGTIGAELYDPRWYAKHGAIDRWEQDYWWRDPTTPPPYNPEWPQWRGLGAPLRVLRNAIAEQSPALRPLAYVDGGKALQPLWLDIWRQLIKVEVQPTSETPNSVPIATLNTNILRALYGNADPDWWPGRKWPGSPGSPFGSCTCDGLIELARIERMIDGWTSQVFPAYGPDKERYAAQLDEGWKALDSYIRGRLGGPLGAISGAARRAGRRESSSVLVAAGLRDVAVASGAIAADAAAVALDRDEQARAARRYSFGEKVGAVGLGVAAAVAIGAAAWRR